MTVDPFEDSVDEDPQYSSVNPLHHGKTPEEAISETGAHVDDLLSVLYDGQSGRPDSDDGLTQVWQ